jgi:hypothetical protein
MQMDMRITRSRRVYTDGKHNAFTSIAAMRGKTFIAFRSGTTHVSLDGVVKVIASTDMQEWQVVAEVGRPGTDLRDPKITTFDGRLMVFSGGRLGSGEPIQSFLIQSSDGVTFSEPVPLRGMDGRFIWGLQPRGKTLYGSAYEDEVVSLYASEDGLAWERISDFPVPGNEAYLDFDREGVLWALVREDERGCIPALCTAEPPYASFRSVMRLPLRLQGPMIKRLDGGCVVVCRQWELPRRNLRTELFWIKDGHDIRRVTTLPSGGDTSYAGWLDTGRGRAVISYYSSHEHKMDEAHADDAVFAQDGAHAEHSTAADILLADVSYD